MITTYEQKLARDPRWALLQGSMHFEGRSMVYDALHRITARLRELNIPHAVVGGMALSLHGYHRFTDDIDILVTRSGLEEIHKRLEGLGYVPPFEGSKNLRDTELRVKIEFLVTGEYPGDGKPKPVAFPDPSAVVTEIAGIPCVNLKTLIELKLASGMSGIERAQDIGDVVNLTKRLRLPRDFADQLNPYVRPKFEEIWDGIHWDAPLE